MDPEKRDGELITKDPELFTQDVFEDHLPTSAVKAQ